MAAFGNDHLAGSVLNWGPSTGLAELHVHIWHLFNQFMHAANNFGFLGILPHQEEKSMTGSAVFSIKAGIKAPCAHLITGQPRAAKHQHKQQIKHIFILLTVNKEIGNAEQSCGCFSAERRIKLKKPSGWIFDGRVCRMMGARRCGRTPDTVVASLCSSFVPQLYQPKADYFISNSQGRLMSACCFLKVP